jgi:hypothetical protein
MAACLLQCNNPSGALFFTPSPGRSPNRRRTHAKRHAHLARGFTNILKYTKQNKLFGCLHHPGFPMSKSVPLALL